jgi:hypothetical protein
MLRGSSALCRVTSAEALAAAPLAEVIAARSGSAERTLATPSREFAGRRLPTACPSCGPSAPCRRRRAATRAPGAHMRPRPDRARTLRGGSADGLCAPVPRRSGARNPDNREQQRTNSHAYFQAFLVQARRRGCQRRRFESFRPSPRPGSASVERKPAGWAHGAMIAAVAAAGAPPSRTFVAALSDVRRRPRQPAASQASQIAVTWEMSVPRQPPSTSSSGRRSHSAT